MGGVMAALASVTAACGCLNTAFDCIGKCCGRTNTESTPQGNITNQSTRDGDAIANNHHLSGNQVENNCCNCHWIWGRQKIPPAAPPAPPTAPPTAPPAPPTTPPPADVNIEEGNTTNNQSVGNTTTTNNQSVGNTTNNQTVGNTTTTNNQSSGNNQYILINVGERTSQLPPAPTQIPPAPSDEGTTSSREPPVEMVDSGGTELIAMGLWGHPYNGNPFDHNGYDGIKTIEIASGDAIDSIKVQYIKRGELVWTSRAGGVGGHSTNKIVLRDGEYINEIRGYSGSYGGTGTINSITFFTNMSRKFGPYGWSDPRKGQLEPSPFFVTGGKIVGIHGTAGKYVFSIGFYVSPDV